MGSALETLCGQAFGAKQLEMLGTYMQRSWVILTTTALVLIFPYIFATPLLKFIGQTADISKWAGIQTQLELISYTRRTRMQNKNEEKKEIKYIDIIRYSISYLF